MSPKKLANIQVIPEVERLVITETTTGTVIKIHQKDDETTIQLPNFKQSAQNVSIDGGNYDELGF